MLHLVKLSVGTRDIHDLAEWQAARAVSHPPLRHRTRMAPRRAAEIIDGGSIYWVITGVVLVRQRILDIRPDTMDDGSACTALVLDPRLVQVEARPMRAFQGWRYLAPEDAPPDLATGGPARGEAAMPPALRRELAALCLL